MSKRSIRSLARDSRLIPGIYNYCDRWCERCRLSSRCLVFAKRQADGEPENDEDLVRQVADDFQEAIDLITEEAEKRGINLAAIPDPEPEDVVRRKVEADALRQHPLLKAAHEYERLATAWLEAHSPAEDAEPDGRAKPSKRHKAPSADLTHEEALDVVGHYQYFFGAKLARALFSSAEDTGEDDASGDAQYDANGSAKAALLAMELALDGWFELMFYEQHTGAILPPLVTLSSLRDQTEQAFPNARAFVRPGFDTGDEPWPAEIPEPGGNRH